MKTMNDKVLTRQDARWTLIREANKFGWTFAQAIPRPLMARYGMRHLQLAANICRRFKLVSPDVLEVAGFRATRE
jgi:hypothetical protein